jgi:hypothetical protein
MTEAPCLPTQVSLAPDASYSRRAKTPHLRNDVMDRRSADTIAESFAMTVVSFVLIFLIGYFSGLSTFSFFDIAFVLVLAWIAVLLDGFFHDKVFSRPAPPPAETS